MWYSSGPTPPWPCSICTFWYLQLAAHGGHCWKFYQWKCKEGVGVDGERERLSMLFDILRCNVLNVTVTTNLAKRWTTHHSCLLLRDCSPHRNVCQGVNDCCTILNPSLSWKFLSKCEFSLQLNKLVLTAVIRKLAATWRDYNNDHD